MIYPLVRCINILVDFTMFLEIFLVKDSTTATNFVNLLKTGDTFNLRDLWKLIKAAAHLSQVSYITKTMTQLVVVFMWHSHSSFVQHFMVCTNYKWKKNHYLFEWHPWIHIIPTLYFNAMLCHKSVDAFIVVRVLVRLMTTTTRLLNC